MRPLFKKYADSEVVVEFSRCYYLWSRPITTSIKPFTIFTPVRKTKTCWLIQASVRYYLKSSHLSVTMAESNNCKSSCSNAFMMTIHISSSEMGDLRLLWGPFPLVPSRSWGRTSADLLWKLSSHLGRVDSDGLASAQRRSALWVSSLLQEKQRADALKCGGFQSLSDSSSHWVMTCEIHGAKMTQSWCVFNQNPVCHWYFQW